MRDEEKGGERVKKEERLRWGERQRADRREEERERGKEGTSGDERRGEERKGARGTDRGVVEGMGGKKGGTESVRELDRVDRI